MFSRFEFIKLVHSLPSGVMAIFVATLKPFFFVLVCSLSLALSIILLNLNTSVTVTDGWR